MPKHPGKENTHHKSTAMGATPIPHPGRGSSGERTVPSGGISAKTVKGANKSKINKYLYLFIREPFDDCDGRNFRNELRSNSY